jgi:predicted regulator of Ras-like GTPase activity (Roadblock/LC7/MglB family)
MDVMQALQELTELSAQVECAVVLDAGGSLLGSTLVDQGAAEKLAGAARELTDAAAELHASDRVVRVEVELADGAVFVLREGGLTIAAVTGPSPTAGLVAYDLRTCLQAIDEKPKRTRRRASSKPKEEAGE